MTTLTQITVPFHNAELYLVEHDGQPYTPMKPIVEGMGLAWQSQLAKLNANPQRWGITKIVIPTLGDLQEMVCLPLRKLLAWLTTISPNKVKPELRDTVIMYQNECDDVLWNYWTKGQVINHRKAISPEQQHALHAIVDRRAGKARSLRASMWIRHNRHFGIAKYSQLLSIHFDDAKQYLETIPLHELGPTETDTLKRLEKFVDNLAARYPA
ncbi:phage antirepressor N-terminal domain-containing protein, partial [Acinetobacter baumannii]